MDNRELFEALALLEKERGIPQDYMLTQIQKAIVIACKMRTSRLLWIRIQETSKSPCLKQSSRI